MPPATTTLDDNNSVHYIPLQCPFTYLDLESQSFVCSLSNLKEKNIAEDDMHIICTKIMLYKVCNILTEI